MDNETQVLLSHQVDILYDFQPTPICTGTILSSYLILTLASCLVNKTVIKLSIQTHSHYQLGPKNEDNNEDEKGRQTRFVDDFYTIKALGPNDTFQSQYQLAIITLDKELEFSEWVNKTRLTNANEEYLQISQPYRCFNSTDLDGSWTHPEKVGVHKTDFSNCTRKNTKSSFSSQIFPSGCPSDPPRSFGRSNNFVCPAPLPGSGLFCQRHLSPSIEIEPEILDPNGQNHTEYYQEYDYQLDQYQNDLHNFESDEDQPEESKNVPFLCGVLSSDSDSDSDGPVYINIVPYLYGIFLSDDNTEEDEEDDEIKYPGIAATSVGGEEVDFGVTSFPYQLSLQQRRDRKWVHSCGAVLLDEETALTAAHCLHPKVLPSRFRLVAGMRALAADGGGHGKKHAAYHQSLRLKNIIFHDKWKNPLFSGGNDIALLTVNGSFVMNENVSAVWISAPNDPVLSGFNGTATGWGKTSDDGGLATNLMVVNLPLLSYKDCKGILRFFKETMICSRSGTTSICSGDSGGPLVLKNYVFPDGEKRDLLVGISSFGPKECEDVTKPSGFTRLSSFYEWIDNNWERKKRNTNTITNAVTTPQNKFMCFNGTEIDGDLRCDKKPDCVDGSDEKGCKLKPIKDEDRPKTRGCGGEIELVDEHDIIYLVEDSQPGKISQCVWTIFNQKNNSIELTLLKNNDAQFDSAQNQLIALHNFTLANFNYESITRIGQKVNISDSYTTLVFRGSAGILNSGFHLRLKSVGNSQEQNQLKFKRVDLKPNATLQTHAYPNNGFYGTNERVFTILTPAKREGRIKVNVVFGGMEKGRDWFDIISIDQQPKSLFRLSETKTRMNETVEGGRDEIVLVFLSTGSPERNRRGIKFTYSEDHPPSIPTQEMECGGNIVLNGSTDLFYKVNPLKSSCAWIISNATADSSQITLLESRSQIFNLTDGSSSLYIVHNFTRFNSSKHQINNFGRVFDVEQSFFVLYFRSSSFSTTTGFFLNVRPLTSNSNSSSSSAFSVAEHPQPIILTPSLRSKWSSPAEFSYPAPKLQNSNSKGTAVILVQPTSDDRKVHFKLNSIHLMNRTEEWAEILTFREQPTSIYRISGSGNIKYRSHTSSEGEPFVIYLKTKSNTNSNLSAIQKNSFKFTFYEQEGNVNETRSCGGVINLGRRHRILYENPPGQRSHCLWIIHNNNAHGPHSNITASFDTANSQLILIQDQKITNLVKNQTITTESSVSALYFRSNGNAETLTVTLKGVSDFGSGENSLVVKNIPLEAKTQRVEEFSYPLAPALNYENNERLFILLTPEIKAGAANKIQLNLTFVDSQPKFDGLELYTFRRNPNETKAADGADFGADGKLHRVLEFSGVGSWMNNTFLGESGEPFLLHFYSDISTVKSGFKFNYKNIPSI